MYIIKEIQIKLEFGNLFFFVCLEGAAWRENSEYMQLIKTQQQTQHTQEVLDEITTIIILSGVAQKKQKNKKQNKTKTKTKKTPSNQPFPCWKPN